MKILGYHYTIVEDGDAEYIGTLGRSHLKAQMIQIAEGLASQQKESTILHEIIEALNFAFGLNLAHQDILSLEAGLYAVLTDNGVSLAPLTREINCEPALGK